MAASVEVDQEDLHQHRCSFPRIRTSPSRNSRLTCENSKKLHASGEPDSASVSPLPCERPSTLQISGASCLLTRQREHSFSDPPSNLCSAQVSPEARCTNASSTARSTSSTPRLISLSPRFQKFSNVNTRKTGFADRVLKSLISVGRQNCLHRYFSSPLASPYQGATFSPSKSPYSPSKAPYASSPAHRQQYPSAIGTSSPSTGNFISHKLGNHIAGHCRGSKVHHACNSFTMMPAGVVGKKKPPDCEVNEPTSPEVTCIGKVKRRNNGKAVWDALFTNENGQVMKGKMKKLAFSSTFLPKLDFMHASHQDDNSCTSSCTGGKWQASMDRNIRRTMDSFHLDLHSELQLVSKVIHEDVGTCLSSVFPSINEEIGTSSTNATPPPDCLLLMRSHGRDRQKDGITDLWHMGL